MKIEYQGYTYFIKQRENETNKETTIRSWYIVKKNPKNKINFDSSEKKSLIVSSKDILNCDYNSNLLNT